MHKERYTAGPQTGCNIAYDTVEKVRVLNKSNEINGFGVRRHGEYREAVTRCW